MTENNLQNLTGGNAPENMAYSGEDEIDLIELIKPLWQQKILIISITFLAVAIAVVMVFQLTPQYKIYTQLQPGTYRWNGNNPISYLQPSDLQSLLTGGSFKAFAATSGFTKKVPELNALTSNNHRSKQVTAYFFWPDRKEGKALLTGFIDFLNKPDQTTSRNKFCGLETDRLKREISRANADLEMMGKEVESLNERIIEIEETRVGYEKNRREIDEYTTKTILLRDKLMQAPPDDSLQFLLLANTLQQNTSYLNIIEQRIATSLRRVVANYKSKEQLIRKQKKSHLKIADLQDKINAISLIEVVVPPGASIKAVKPKKRKIVALAGIMGLFLATIIVYIRHFIKH
ncbi:hypothetical protein KAI46_13970 [bacterium]|nr:hypothetical protein [bacterium]